MSGIATAVVATAVIGGVVQSNASSKAADAQQAAADKASATELEQYYQNREDLAPWRKAGQTALGQLTTGLADGGDFNRSFTLSDFTKDPGYDFRLQEGQTALDRSAAARGGALSGAAIKGQTRYAQDYASNEYANAYNRFNTDQTSRFNRLASVAGVGQTAATTIANNGTQTASNVANNTTSAGNAQASSYVGQGNAVTGAAQTLGNFAMNKYFLGNTGTPSSSYPSYTGGWGDTGSTTLYG